MLDYGLAIQHNELRNDPQGLLNLRLQQEAHSMQKLQPLEVVAATGR